MKKQDYKKQKFDYANGKRNEWKNEAEDEIILMQEQMDELADELGLSEETILKLEKIVDEFKDRLNNTIELFSITPKIAAHDRDFVDEFINYIYLESVPLSESASEDMISILEINEGKGQFVKMDSLAQQMRLDELLNEFQENPYQLKLIA